MYRQKCQDLSKRYRRSQIKVALKVNTEMLKFYWSLGRDIVAMKAESRWGSNFFKNLSKELKEQIPNASYLKVKKMTIMKLVNRLLTNLRMRKINLVSNLLTKLERLNFYSLGASHNTDRQTLR